MNLKSEELLASTHKNLQFNTLKYKYAVENSNIGIWEWDIITNKVYHSN